MKYYNKKISISIILLLVFLSLLLLIPFVEAWACYGEGCDRRCCVCCDPGSYQGTIDQADPCCCSGWPVGSCDGEPSGPCDGKSAGYVCDSGDELRCSGSGCGDDVQKIHWERRCDGSSDDCPSQKYYTTGWETQQNCASNEKCNSATNSCVYTAECDCAGKPAGTVCGDSGYELRCSGNGCGDNVQKRLWERRCDGSSSNCPSQKYYGDWFVLKDCVSNEKCDSNINGCVYAAECDDDNNQQLCESHGYIWINNKCCGNNENEFIKKSYDGCQLGCCNSNDQCLVNPYGNEANNNVPERYHSPSASDWPMCIRSGQFIEDMLCINGEWYSRTGMVATQLLSFSNSQGQDSSMYCGSYDEVLNYFGYKTSEGTYIREYFENYCLINTKYVPCFNNLCVLKQGDLVLIAGSLNAQNYGVMFKAFNYTGTCSNALNVNYNTFVKCTDGGPAQLWFKNDTQMFIYENLYEPIQSLGSRVITYIGPPIIISSSCTDSDGGKNYYVQGTTTLGSRVETDSCTYCTGFCPPTGPCPPVICGAVVEYFCDGGEIKSETYVCPNGCKNGACVKGGNFIDAFKNLITTPLLEIAKFLTGITNPPKDYSKLPYVAEWKKPDELYFSTVGNKEVVAIYERACFEELNPPKISIEDKATILVVEYKGFSFDFCEVINELNPTICYKDGNRYYVVIGSQDIEEPLPLIWASLTGKLRIS